MEKDYVNAESNERAQKVWQVIGINDHHSKKTAGKKRQDPQKPIPVYRKKCVQNPEKNKNVSPFQDKTKNIQKMCHSISPQ